jgi:PAS domain S-box-containing protein
MNDQSSNKDLITSLNKTIEMYEKIMTQSGIFTWETDATGLYTQVGNNVQQVIGYTQDELIGKKYFYDLHPEKGRSDFQREALKVMNKCLPYHDYENQIQHKDGHIVWVNTTGIPLMKNDQLIGYQGSDTTITKRIQLMEELKQQRERYELAINGSNDGIWDWNIQTNEIFFSDRWKAQLGYQPDEIKHDFEEFRNRIHPDDLTRVLKSIDDYISSVDLVYDNDFRLKNKNGEYVWIRSRGALIRDAAGLPYRMAGSHTDITEKNKSKSVCVKRTSTLKN